MRVQHKLIILLLFLWLIVGNRQEVRAQDPQFTQFFANPLYISPSYAGASLLGHRIILGYRDQWSGMPNMFRTISFSYDLNAASLRSGFGIFALGDLAGDGRLGSIQTGIVYSYSVSLTSDWSFRPGLGFYYVQRSLAFHRLVWSDQLIGGTFNPTTQQQQGKPIVYDIDVSASLLFHSRSAWVGLGWDHILRPKNSFYGDESRVPFKFSLYGGYRFILNSIFRGGISQSLSLASMIRYMDKSLQFDIGMHWYRDPIVLGISYRGVPFGVAFAGSDAVAFLGGIRLTNFQLLYSYDLTVSSFGPATGGSHEISLTYEIKYSPKKKKYKAPICPPY